jgi:hypothetical protein
MGIIGVDIMEGRKGLTCALFKGIGKVLGWGSTFTLRITVGRGNWWVVCGLLKWYGG